MCLRDILLPYPANFFFKDEAAYEITRLEVAFMDDGGNRDGPA